jgi:hypothetical protein
MHDDVPEAVVRAAEARAQGLSWPAAAEQAGWELHGLRCWIRRYAAQWARVYGRARREAHDAAGDEAVTMLRRRLRDGDAKTVLAAATALIARFAAGKSKPRAAKGPDPDAAMDEWLRGLSEPQVGQLIRQLDPAAADGDKPDP